MTNASWPSKRSQGEKIRLEWVLVFEKVLKRLQEAEKFWLNSVGPKLSKRLLPTDGWVWPDAERAS